MNIGYGPYHAAFFGLCIGNPDWPKRSSRHFALPLPPRISLQIVTGRSRGMPVHTVYSHIVFSSST